MLRCDGGGTAARGADPHRRVEIAPDDGLVLAGGPALTLSVREFGLLVALAHSDVYIHELRVKLEAALPSGGSFIPTAIARRQIMRWPRCAFGPPLHPVHSGAGARA
jgi:hypothetical protein